MCVYVQEKDSAYQKVLQELNERLVVFYGNVRAGCDQLKEMEVQSKEKSMFFDSLFFMDRL
jgi:hypothetical protein